MKAFDPLAGKPQRSDGFGRGRGGPLGNFAAREAKAGVRQVNAVEAAGIIDQRGVAPLYDIVDDRGDSGIDIRGTFPLGIEQLPESRFEPGCARCEPNRHQTSLRVPPVAGFEFYDAADRSRRESARSNRRPLPGGSSARIG